MSVHAGTTVAPGDRDAEESNEHVRLRDVINLMLGLAIIIAPWFTGDDASTHGAIRIRLIAVGVCAVSLWVMSHQRDQVGEWWNAVLGAALGTAAFWHAGVGLQRLECGIAGAIIIAFSVSSALQIARENRSGRKPRERFRATHVAMR